MLVSSARSQVDIEDEIETYNYEFVASEKPKSTKGITCKIFNNYKRGVGTTPGVETVIKSSLLTKKDTEEILSLKNIGKVKSHRVNTTGDVKYSITEYKSNNNLTYLITSTYFPPGLNQWVGYEWVGWIDEENMLVVKVYIKSEEDFFKMSTVDKESTFIYDRTEFFSYNVTINKISKVKVPTSMVGKYIKIEGGGDGSHTYTPGYVSLFNEEDNKKLGWFIVKAIKSD